MGLETQRLVEVELLSKQDGPTCIERNKEKMTMLLSREFGRVVKALCLGSDCHPQCASHAQVRSLQLPFFAFSMAVAFFLFVLSIVAG